MGSQKLDRIAFFIPRDIGVHKKAAFTKLGSYFGHVITTIEELEKLPIDIIPMVGCTIELGPLVRYWQKTNRPFIYWDRGYFRRQGFTSLPRPNDDGYFRVHLNTFQMETMSLVPDDRFRKCSIKVAPWRKSGHKIVVAEPTKTYAAFHGLKDWTEKTIKELRQYTDRPIRVRKKQQNNTLESEIRGAHALVTHGSIAAVESVIFGVPVFVDRSSAALHVGKVDLSQIEDPATPDRTEWLNALAYCQFTKRELIDGRAFEYMDL